LNTATLEGVDDSRKSASSGRRRSNTAIVEVSDCRKTVLSDRCQLDTAILEGVDDSRKFVSV